MPHPLSQAQSAQRRTVLATTLFVVFVCVSMLAVELWQAWKARDQTLRQAEVSNSNLALAVAQQMDGLVSEVGHLLESIAFELELGGTDTPVLDHLQPILKHHAQTNQHVHGIFVYDAQGAWLVNSQAVFPSGANNADRDYFIQHRDNPSLETKIGKPIVSRSTGIWIIPISRRLNDRAGHFAGVVLATLNVAHIHQILSTFKIGEHGSLAFALADGTVLVRRPFSIDSLGKGIPGTALQRIFMSQSTGTYEMASPLDGVERLGSFQHTQNHPLLVTVAMSKHEILQPWRDSTWLQAVWILLLCAVTAAAGGHVIHAVRQRMSVELHLGRTRDALTQANARLARLASHDALTGLANRRHFDEVLTRAFAESCRSGQPLALVMIDVDHFKQYNDHYGHPEGDRCLQQVAHAIDSAARRPLDFVARYGGEEMAMVLPNTDGPGAVVVAEAARAAVQALVLSHAASPSGHVSVSAGIATHSMDGDTDSVQGLIDRADKALYRAKAEGKNRVCAESETVVEPGSERLTTPKTHLGHA